MLAVDPSVVEATQAQLEAAAAGGAYVSPRRMKYHPGVAKAWVKFNGSGAVAIDASHNVTSITDNGVGDYTINLTAAFSSANYAVVGTGGRTGTTENLGGYITIRPSGISTTSIRIVVFRMSNTDGEETLDPPDITILAFGDQ